MPRAIPDRRFDELLEAAAAVFLEQGYRRTQVADVAARMGLSKGSVYTYVESKEALFDCVLRHADRTSRVELPSVLPVCTPPRGATFALLEKRLAEEGALPALETALARTRVTNVGAEFETILSELYDGLARNRFAIRLVERCARDYPELARIWYRAGREDALARLGAYLDDRTRRGRLRPFESGAVAARIVLETVVFWAVHRHWDPSPQAVEESSAKRNMLAVLTSAFVKDER